jgi:hypothetical protein
MINLNLVSLVYFFTTDMTRYYRSYGGERLENGLRESYTYMLINTHVYKQIFQMYISIYIHIYIHMYTYIHIYVYIYTYICIHIYMCIYIHMNIHIQDVIDQMDENDWRIAKENHARKEQVIFLYLCLIGCSLRFTCRG